MQRIEDLELSEAIDKFPSELSGGMQKRWPWRGHFVTDPKIVLFDEPTTGQDPIRKEHDPEHDHSLQEKVRIYRRHDQP